MELWGLGGRAEFCKFLGFEDHLDWLKIDLYSADRLLIRTIIAQKINVNGSTHI